MTPPTEAEALALWNELGSLRAVASGQVHYRSSAAHVVPGPRLVTALVLDDFAEDARGHAGGRTEVTATQSDDAALRGRDLTFGYRRDRTVIEGSP